MAASIGLYTLLIWEKIEQIPAEMEEGKKDFDRERRKACFEDITMLVISKIVPAQIISIENEAEVEVLYGTPGYMYSLLSILSKIEPWRTKDLNADVIYSKVSQVLVLVTHKLVK